MKRPAVAGLACAAALAPALQSRAAPVNAAPAALSQEQIALANGGDVLARMLGAEAPLGPIVDQPALFGHDDLLWLEVQARDEVLTDALSAYSSRAGVFLPLGEIARLLDIAVVVDPSKQRAEGWIGTPDNTVRIDLRSGQVHAKGRDFSTSPTDAALFEDEIYVRADLLEALLPLEVKVDIGGAAVSLTPTIKLPFEERLERERRRSRAASDDEQARVLKVFTPYDALSEPSIDVNLEATYGSEAPRRTTRYEVRAGGDIAWAGAQFFAGSDEQGELDNVRVLLERKDPDRRRAGPFGATRSNLGDTFTPSLPFGARSMGGRGFAITSASLDQASVFERIDLRGELPLGYQAELYVNEVLRATQTQPIQGRYEFEDVDLVYGLNVIRIVFYGPRGERRQEVRRINLGGGALRRGEAVYSLGAVQEDKTVFGVSDAGPRSVAHPGYGENRMVGSLAYGLTNTLTVTAGLAQYTPRLGDTRGVGAAGAIASIRGFSVQLDAAMDDQHGSAIGLGVAGRPFGVSFIARHSEYEGGFVDEVQPAALDVTSNLIRNSNLFVDFVAPLGRASLPLSARFARDEFEDGKVRVMGGLRASQAVDRYFVSSSFDYQRTSGGGLPTDERLVGGLEASGLVRADWQVRGGVAYPILPDLELQSAYLSADRAIGDRSALHLGVNHSFEGRETSFQVGQTWRLAALDLSLNGSYTTPTNEFRVGLQLSFGLTPDPYRGRYRLLGPGSAAGGAVAVRAFVDENADGAWQASERVLPDVKVSGGRRDTMTDERGAAVITGLGDGASAQVVVDMDSIEDPYLAAPPRAIRIVPRPGRVAEAPYALKAMGEVELNVLVQRAGEAARGVSAVQVQLLASDGKVAAEGRTEFDGALILERLAPGAYTVRIDPEQAARLNMKLAAPVSVIVPPGGGFAGKKTAQVVFNAPAS